MGLYERSDTGLRTLLIVAAMVIVIAGLKTSQALVVPLLASAMIAILFLPAMMWLQRRKLPDWLALSIVLVGVLGLFALMTIGVGKSISDFNGRMDHYQVQLAARFGDSLEAVELRLADLGFHFSTDEIAERFDPRALLRYFGNVAGAAADLLSNTFLIVLTVAFLLGEAAGFPRKLAEAFGGEELIEGDYHEAVSSVREYLRIKTELSLGTGILAGGACAIIGVDFPILWGSVAFVLNFVPNVGSIIASLPPLLLAFVQFGWERALAVAVVYGLINTVIGNVIEPRLMGRKLGLSSLVVWVSLVFWGWVWGPIGMLLSVPLTMLVKLLLERSDDLRWIAVLLGPADEAPVALPEGPVQTGVEYSELDAFESGATKPNDD